MLRRRRFIPIILICFIISTIVLFAFHAKKNNGISNTITTIFVPVQKFVFSVHNPIVNTDNAIKKLQNENDALRKRLVDQTKLAKENEALRDQFQTTTLPSQHLLPATIIGVPGFLPGISLPEAFIIDRGSRDGIKKGMPVVYKDVLVGSITDLTASSAYVVLLTAKNTSFTATTLDKNALGVIKGQGNGAMILDNILLSQQIKKNDIIVTNGDVHMDGSGYPPGLVVGRITAIEKNPSALFQKADVVPAAVLTELSTVFVLVEK